MVYDEAFGTPCRHKSLVMGDPGGFLSRKCDFKDVPQGSLAWRLEVLQEPSKAVRFLSWTPGQLVPLWSERRSVGLVPVSPQPRARAHCLREGPHTKPLTEML